MKAGFATMDDRLWSSLEQSGFQFLGELKGHFLTPWHVACAVDSLDDTILLVRQLKSGLLESEEKREAKCLWQWLLDNAGLLKRVQARLLAKSQRVEAFVREPPPASSIYDQQVSGSIELQKQVSKSQHRWLANGNGTPVEAEKAAKKFHRFGPDYVGGRPSDQQNECGYRRAEGIVRSQGFGFTSLQDTAKSC